jgi:hypothetical protein
MTRIMRDSTTPTDIPIHGTDLAAGYINGSSKWKEGPEGFGRFPEAKHVHIDVDGTNPEGAGVVDCEIGDVSVAGAVRWAKARKAAHPGEYPPVIYCNRSTLTPLFNAMNAAGLHIVEDFRLWIATLDGTKTVHDMTGVTAVQYAGENMTGGHYDESIVYDDHWHAHG